MKCDIWGMDGRSVGDAPLRVECGGALERLEAVLLICRVLVDDEEISIRPTYDEAHVELTEHLHLLER